jgi:hypothetical protein
MGLDDPFHYLAFPVFPSAQPTLLDERRLAGAETLAWQVYKKRSRERFPSYSPQSKYLPSLKLTHRSSSSSTQQGSSRMKFPQLPQISTRNEMRILNWGHVAQITMVLAVIILAFIKIGTGNVRGRGDVWGLSVVSDRPH